MWQSLAPENKKYLLRHIFDDTSSTFLITDAIYLWKKKISNKDIIQLFQEQNPLVEAAPDTVLKHVKNLFDFKKYNSVTKLQNSEKKVLFTITSKSLGILFTLSFHLDLMEPIVLYEEIIAPLFLCVQTLQSQQKYLTDLLHKKDLEISEYKLEGNEISRKNIITSKFDETQLYESASYSEINYSEPSNIISNFKLFDEMSSLLKIKKGLMVDEILSEGSAVCTSEPPCLPSKNSTQNEASKKDYSDTSDDELTSQGFIEKSANPIIASNSNIGKKLKKRKLNL